MRSLPGDSASNERVVSRPYTTAQPAQTSATTTPWFVRKLLKKILRGLIGVPREDLRAHLVARNARSEAAPGANARGVYRYAPTKGGWRITASGHPEAPAGLRRTRTPAGLLLLLGCALARPLGLAGGIRPRAGRRCRTTLLGPRCRLFWARRAGLGRGGLRLARVCHLKLRERIAQGSELPGVPALEHVHQRAHAVDRVTHLLEVAARARSDLRGVCGIRGRAKPARAEVQQRDRRLHDHLGGRDAFKLGFVGGAQLLLAVLPARARACRTLARARACLARLFAGRGGVLAAYTLTSWA
jgi:hypothetical protein